MNLAAMADATGVAPRTLQFWADRGALRYNYGFGRGNPRDFGTTEAVLAQVLAELDGFSIHLIKEIAEEIRPQIQRGIRKFIIRRTHYELHLSA